MKSFVCSLSSIPARIYQLCVHRNRPMFHNDQVEIWTIIKYFFFVFIWILFKSLQLNKVFIFTWKMRNVQKRMKNLFLRHLVFEIWSILYFDDCVCDSLRTWFRNATTTKPSLWSYSYQNWKEPENYFSECTSSTCMRVVSISSLTNLSCSE